VAEPRILVLFGDDSFTRDEEVRRLKQARRAEPGGEYNLDELQAEEVDLPRLRAICATVPFLAERRLVLVHNLLSGLLAPVDKKGKVAGKSAATATNGEAPPEVLKGILAELPATTTLVLVEGRLDRRRVEPLLPRGRARLVEFPRPRNEELESWIRQRAAHKGLRLSDEAIGALRDDAVRLFEYLRAADLARLDAELEKLAAYADGQVLDTEQVRLLATLHEENVFALLDAVTEGRSGEALARLRGMLERGVRVDGLLPQLAAHVRRLLVAQETASRRLSPDEVARDFEVSPWLLRRLQPLARQLSARQLDAACERLLEADRAIKAGQRDPEAELELAVARVAVLLRRRM